MATAAYPIFNSDPNVQSQAALLDQRQRLAQALMEQGLAPDQGGTQMAGQFAIRKSPLEGLAKIFQAYAGGKMLQDTAQQRGNLAAQAYGAQLQANQPQTAPKFAPEQVAEASSEALKGGGGPTNENARRMGQLLVAQQPGDPGNPANPRNPLNVPAELLTAYQAGMIPKEVFESQVALYKPTDATVQARQGGMDPTLANQQAFAKTVTDPAILKLRQAGLNDDQIKRFVQAEQIKNAEIDRKSGNQYYNFATGDSGMVPKIPENANPVGAVQPNGAVQGVAPIPGALPMSQANAGAAEAGKAPFNIVEGFDPARQAPVKNYAGNVLRQPGQVVQPAVQAQRDQERLRILRQERAKPTNSAADNAALDREIVSTPGGIQSGPSLGQPKAAEAAQDQLSKKFSDLQGQNSQAQTTNSYLRNIKDLSSTAVTGKFSDRLQFINSLLSTVGNEKATDATTANNLLDKYSNQIVARLGQGGLGTDSARSILKSAYPNEKMTKEAISEAVDNLIGANEMVMAKSRLLAPHGNSKDPVKYQQVEQVFDQNADPRMWQYANIRDPEARQRFLQGVLKNDPSFLQRAEKLHSIGAL